MGWPWRKKRAMASTTREYIGPDLPAFWINFVVLRHESTSGLDVRVVLGANGRDEVCNFNVPRARASMFPVGERISFKLDRRSPTPSP